MQINKTQLYFSVCSKTMTTKHVTLINNKVIIKNTSFIISIYVEIHMHNNVTRNCVLFYLFTTVRHNVLTV